MNRKFLWAAAFLLPPIVQTKSFVWKEMVSSLAQRSARSVESLSQVPSLEGEFFVSDNHQEIFRAVHSNGKMTLEQAQRSQLAQGSLAFHAAPGFKAETSLAKRAWNFPEKFRVGAFELTGERLSFYPNGYKSPAMWNSNLGEAHWSSVYQNRRGGLLGLDSVVSRAFYFQRYKNQIFVYNWDEGSHLVRFFPCDNSQDLLVENAPEVGLTRFVFWADGAPQSYTVFDFSTEGQPKSPTSPPAEESTMPASMKSSTASTVDNAKSAASPGTPSATGTGVQTAPGSPNAPVVPAPPPPAGPAHHSQVTWVEAFDCRDIVVGGNFGLARIRY